MLLLLQQWWRRPSRQPRSRTPWLICRSCVPSLMRYACVADWPGHMRDCLHADEMPACLWLSDHRAFDLGGLVGVAAGTDLYCLLPSLPSQLRLTAPRRCTAPSLRSRWTSSSRPQPQQPAQHALTWLCRWEHRADPESTAASAGGQPAVPATTTCLDTFMPTSSGSVCRPPVACICFAAIPSWRQRLRGGYKQQLCSSTVSAAPSTHMYV